MEVWTASTVDSAESATVDGGCIEPRGRLLLGAAQNQEMLFAAWLVIGIGMAMGLYEAAFSTLAGIYGPEARSAITGITLLAGFASTICWPISAWLDTAFAAMRPLLWLVECLSFYGGCQHLARFASRHIPDLGTNISKLSIPFSM